MLQSWIGGRWSGRCVPWVILSRPDVGANTGSAISLQPLHAFKLNQAWELGAIKDNQKILKWSHSRVWVESGGPKRLLTSASFECTAQRESFPRPNPHRICGPILHIYSNLKLGVWGCVWETARTLPTLNTIFLKLPSTYRTNFNPKTSIRTRKIEAIQWCAQVRKRCGGCKVMPWEAYLAMFA